MSKLKEIAVGLDLNGNEIRDFHVLLDNEAPEIKSAGMFYFNTEEGILYYSVTNSDSSGSTPFLWKAVVNDALVNQIYETINNLDIEKLKWEHKNSSGTVVSDNELRVGYGSLSDYFLDDDHEEYDSDNWADTIFFAFEDGEESGEIYLNGIPYGGGGKGGAGTVKSITLSGKGPDPEDEDSKYLPDENGNIDLPFSEDLMEYFNSLLEWAYGFTSGGDKTIYLNLGKNVKTGSTSSEISSYKTRGKDVDAAGNKIKTNVDISGINSGSWTKNPNTLEPTTSVTSGTPKKLSLNASFDFSSDLTATYQSAKWTGTVLNTETDEASESISITLKACLKKPFFVISSPTQPTAADLATIITSSHTSLSGNVIYDSTIDDGDSGAGVTSKALSFTMKSGQTNPYFWFLVPSNTSSISAKQLGKSAIQSSVKATLSSSWGNYKVYQSNEPQQSGAKVNLDTFTISRSYS